MADDAFERIAARADVARLLAACYYQPGPEFAEEDVFGSLQRAAREVDARMGDHATALGDAFAAQPILDLKVDYTRLFLSPAGAVASPYESFWIAGRDPATTQEAVLAVLDAYRAGSFELDEGFRDQPDHIAAELEFLYALLYAEARGRSIGDPAAERSSADLRRRFVERHLGRWVAPFVAAVRAEAQTPFYRTLAELTDRFVSAQRA
jgi:TorA maturation chaperone TorD